MMIEPDSSETWAIRRRATDALQAKIIGEEDIRSNIRREMRAGSLFTEDAAENDSRVNQVFEQAKYWVNPSIYSG